MTRRGFIKGLLGTILTGLFVSFYAFFVEPALRLRVRKWRVSRDDWPQDAPIKIAMIADLHMGAPWVTQKRLRQIVARTNALGADLIVFMGDLNASHAFVQRKIATEETCAILGTLRAPMGVFAVLGNHDWWDDRAAQRRGSGPTEIGIALGKAGLQVLENDAVALPGGVWLGGLGDQWAFRTASGFRGVDDLAGTLARIPRSAPTILLAHEPDIFPQVPDTVALTLSGHTHGGQIRIFGWSPVVPSKFANRYAYGLVREGRKTIVTSGGIGCSVLPLRFGVVPEITLVTMEAGG